MSKSNTEILQTVVRIKDETTKILNKIQKEFDNLNAKIETVPEATERAGTGIGKLNGSIFNLNNALKLFTVQKFISFAKDITTYALNASSDMTELENVTEQVFGKMTDDVEKFAKKMGSEMGRSVYSMKKYVSDMGAVLKGLGGFDDTQIKEMAQNLATLAVDIGSFRNIEDSQAFNALRGGIVGETEALKQLGIVINDTVMKEYALKKGYKQSWETLDVNTKTQLRYQAILEKTVFMQGDAARTIDSYANQLKVFQANTSNLAVTIGNKMTPAVNGVLGSINRILKATDEWLNKKDVSDYVRDFVVEKNNILTLNAEYAELSKKVNLTADEEKRRLEIFNKMQSMYPDILKNLSSEKKAYEEVGEAIGKVIDKLKEKTLTKFIEESNNAYISKLQDFEKQVDDKNAKIQDISNNLELNHLNSKKKSLDDIRFLEYGKAARQYLSSQNIYYEHPEELNEVAIGKQKLKGDKRDYDTFVNIARFYGYDVSSEKKSKDLAKQLEDIYEQHKKIKEIERERNKYVDDAQKEYAKNEDILKQTLDKVSDPNNALYLPRLAKEKRKLPNSIPDKPKTDPPKPDKPKVALTEYQVLVNEFGEKSREAKEAKLKELKEEFSEIFKLLQKGEGKKGQLKLKGAKIAEVEAELAKLKKVDPVPTIKDNIKDLNDKLVDLTNKYDIKLNDNLIEDLSQASNIAKEKFIESIKTLIANSVDDNSIFANLKDVNVDNIDTIKSFLNDSAKNYANLSALDKEKIKHANKALNEYIAADKKIKDKEIKEKEKILQERLAHRDKIINDFKFAFSQLNRVLNGIGDLVGDSNGDLKKSIHTVANVIDNVSGVALGIASGNIPQAIESGIGLLFEFAKGIIPIFQNIEKDIDIDFKNRKEHSDNIAKFINLKNAIQDLTDTIIESTSKLATNVNIQQNKAIFKELNSLYTQRGFNQDVVVNGSFFRQNGIKNTGARAVVAWLTAGLSEIIPLKKSKFEKTFKLEDFIDLKGKSSKELKELYNNTSEKDLNNLIYKKTKDTVIGENNWNGSARVDITSFKANSAELKNAWLKYIEQVEKQEKELAEFDKNVIKESLDGISVVDVNKEKKQILEYYKKIITDENEYNKILPELEKKVDELLKSKSEIVTALNDVRINTISELSNGNDTLSSLSNGMQTYFNKIRNNIAKMQLDSKNGIFKGLDDELSQKFSQIANDLVRIRTEGKKLTDLKVDFSKQFAKMKELNKVNNEVIEIVKKLREQALAEGIDSSIVDKMLPLGDIEKKGLDIKNALAQAMKLAIDTNSFNQFSNSLGSSIHQSVKDGLIRAFTESENYRVLIKKFLSVEDFKSKFNNATSLEEAYNIIKKELDKAERVLQSKGLGFRETDASNGEYLGGFANSGANNISNFANAKSGININITNNIDNKGFLAVDDLSESITELVKTKLENIKKREV